MRHLFIAAGLAATALTSTVNAQESCQERRDNRTVGTVAGAGIGAVLGGAIGGNALGAVLGGVGGGVIGNQVARGPEDCVHAYGYYDNGGRWHGNRVEAGAATGFYDRDGRWVAGAPAGYYDRDGRWIQTDAGRGYRDRNGYWVAAGAPGYYAEGGYVTAQPVAQVYSGSPPPYPDNRPYPNAAPGGPGAYPGGPRGYYGDLDPRDIRGRIARTAERINRSVAHGDMTPDQARRARRDLDSVNRQQSAMRHYDGYLGPRDQDIISARLDEINGRIRATRDEMRTDYPR